MSNSRRGRFKSFFTGLWPYAKAHPYKTAAAAAVLVLGGLLIVGGIVLMATAPASFGGGAAVGAPLLGIGTGLAVGLVVVAVGAVLSATAAGYVATSAQAEHQRNKVEKRLQKVDGMSMEVHLKSSMKQTESKVKKRKKSVHFADKIEAKDAIKQIGVGSSSVKQKRTFRLPSIKSIWKRNGSKKEGTAKRESDSALEDLHLPKKH